MVITNYSSIVNEFLKVQVFSSVIANSGYKSVGIKILDGKKVVEEVTSCYDKKRISIKKSIINPDFIVTVDNKFLKGLNHKKIEWIKANPIKAYLKYHDKVCIPFFVKLKILSLLRDEI